MGDETAKPKATESDAAKILQYTSPEFQAAVNAEEEARRKQDALDRQAQIDEAIAEQKRADLTGNIFVIGMWILILGALLGVIYVLTKFVKWAWYN